MYNNTTQIFTCSNNSKLLPVSASLSAIKLYCCPPAATFIASLLLQEACTRSCTQYFTAKKGCCWKKRVQDPVHSTLLRKRLLLEEACTRSCTQYFTAKKVAAGRSVYKIVPESDADASSSFFVTLKKVLLFCCYTT
jgi:hypothetical protein